MKISEMIPGKYLKQNDFDEAGSIVTISHITQENVAKDDEPQEWKFVLFFAETPSKGMVLNPTNIKAVAKACGTEETDEWVGREVVVYVDPNVGFEGKTTGGLRIRSHQAQQAPRPLLQRPQAPLRSSAPAASRIPARSPPDQDDDVPY